VLRLAGIEEPYRRTELPTGTGELIRIRTGYHPADAELHVVLDLADPAVGVESLQLVGSSLRVVLRRGGL
jgi:hypothetical protein